MAGRIIPIGTSELWYIPAEYPWYIVGEYAWYIVGECPWRTVGECDWYILGECHWYIIGCSVTLFKPHFTKGHLSDGIIATDIMNATW
jgi:hypothetical protein